MTRFCWIDPGLPAHLHGRSHTSAQHGSCPPSPDYMLHLQVSDSDHEVRVRCFQLIVRFTWPVGVTPRQPAANRGLRVHWHRGMEAHSLALVAWPHAICNHVTHATPLVSPAQNESHSIRIHTVQRGCAVHFRLCRVKARRQGAHPRSDAGRRAYTGVAVLQPIERGIRERGPLMARSSTVLRAGARRINSAKAFIIFD